MSRSLIKWVFGLFLARLLIMALLPVMGDEAYYIYWAQHPAGGYYDLPPMVGWWLIPLAKFTLNPFVLRIPNLLAWGLTTFGLYEWVSKESDEKRAWFAALSFACLPLPFLAVLNFPDVPLLYTGFFAAYFFFQGISQSRKRFTGVDLLISGALWGAAFLSKYFAVFLIPAFGIWFLFEKKKKWTDLGWFTLGAFPFVFQHVYWNRTHCWANFVFNLITRQKVYEGPRYETVGLLVLYVLLVSAPLLRPARFKQLLKGSSSERFLLLLWATPLSIFFLTALGGRGQGLHWLLFIVPFFVAWVFLRLPTNELKKHTVHTMGHTTLFSLIVLTALAFPDHLLPRFFEHRFKFEYRFAFHSKEFVNAIRAEIAPASEVVTEGYTFSSDLAYALKRHAPDFRPQVGVWGAGSRFGRVFDWTANWKKLDGKTISIVTPGSLWFWKWTQFFDKLTPKEIKVGEVSIYVARGEGFHAQRYIQDEVKKSILEFYPQFSSGKCALKE